MARKAVPGLRSQELVFTLFGDYLLERDQPVWTGALITLLGQLGLSPMAVRTVLSRMALRGVAHGRAPRHPQLVRSDPQGPSPAGLGARANLPPGGRRDVGRTVVGDHFLHPGREAPAPRRPPGAPLVAWLPGSWRTASGSRDETSAPRSARSPPSSRWRGTSRYFGVGVTGGSSAARLVTQCWDLDALNRRYAAFIARWRQDFDHCRQCGMTGARAGVHKPCTEPGRPLSPPVPAGARGFPGLPAGRPLPATATAPRRLERGGGGAALRKLSRCPGWPRRTLRSHRLRPGRRPRRRRLMIMRPTPRGNDHA